MIELPFGMEGSAALQILIPRFCQQNIKMVSRPMAERYGIANVKWRLAGDGPEFIAPPIAVEKFSEKGVGG